MRLSAVDLYKLARAAGFPSDTAVKMVAIALRESGGDPMAHNGVPPDDSYGLWQINMLGKLLPERLKQFGLTDPRQLFDPMTNARAAFKIWAGNDANLARHWYIDRNTAIPYKDRYEANLTLAAQARAQVDGGSTAPGPILADVTFRGAPSTRPRPSVLIPLAAGGTPSVPELVWLSELSPDSQSLKFSPDDAVTALIRAYGLPELRGAFDRAAVRLSAGA